MKKNKLMLLGIIACTVVLSGCSAKKEASEMTEAKKETEIQTTAPTTEAMPESNTSDIQTTQAETQSPDSSDSQEDFSDVSSTDGSNTEIPSYPSEEAGSVQYDSTLGYSCTYDPTVFVLDDTGDGDRFSYRTSETLAAPVYMSVQMHSDMSAETLAEGLALQSGIDGVEVQDTYFGANGIATKSVYIEQEINGVNQIQTFYAIPSGTGSLLVELGGYVGMPDGAEHKLQEITGSFSFAG